MTFRLFKKLNKDLVVLDSIDGRQMWTRGRLRKSAVCAVTNNPISDKAAWRPLGNDQNRYLRISDAGMKQIEKPSA